MILDLPATAKESLREMHDLLVQRGQEYDRNGHSFGYWAIHARYEYVKAHYYELRNQERNG